MTKLNMKISPKQMLLSAINSQNNLHLAEDDVNIRPPVVIADAVEEDAVLNGVNVKLTRNTSVDVDVLSDDVKDNFVTFKYQRISLEKLFSVCNPTMREVDIKTDGVVTVGEVVTEILRKYSVLANDTSFDYTVTQNQIVLTAKSTNLAFIDAASFVIEQSLLSRIAIMDLNGFNIDTETTVKVWDDNALWDDNAILS